MGNCLRHHSKDQWGGEDWSPAIISDDEKFSMNMEEEVDVNSTKCEQSKVNEVKVKLTKKQLEELLGKMDVQQQGLSAKQILVQLIEVSVQYETHLRSWKPRLQSIPEL